jgi:hypothetical protein
MMQKLEKEIAVLVCKMENILAWMVQCDATFASALTLES